MEVLGYRPKYRDFCLVFSDLMQNFVLQFKKFAKGLPNHCDSSVYVQCGYDSNKMCTPTMFFVHNEIMCAFLLQSTHNLIMFRNNRSKYKNVFKSNPCKYVW